VRYNQFKPLLFHLQRLLRPYTSRPGVEPVSGRVAAAGASSIHPSPLPEAA
jgi:hypothetical protein